MSELNMEYKREGLNYYIIIKQEVENQLELKMLSRNQPKALLPIEVRNQDGNTYFYYNITNEKNLKKIVEKTALSYQEIKILFQSIFETIEMTKEYFLEADSLLFQEEMIYKSDHYRFIYLPGKKNNIINQMQELVSYLMDKIDHKDQEAVVYIYGLYRIIREENFDMEVLRNFENEKETNPYEKIVEEHRQQKEEMQTILYQQEREEREERERQALIEKKKISQNKSDLKRENQVFISILRWIPLSVLAPLLVYEGYYIYGKAASIEIQVICIFTFFGFLVYLISLFWWEKKRKEKKKTDKLFADLERQSNTMYSNETTVLEESCLRKNLAKLSPISGKGEYPIFITKEKFIVGNMLGNADGKIDRKQISRTHALIEKRGDKFFIKDLKSTNGTTVNGIFLREEEFVHIKDGDEIEFGDCAYLFKTKGTIISG
ncbi:MAG: DUF6382 domain-containing protein [Lachnospiraceae bacterium]